ncbi:MAG: acyl-CoA thioesterase [Gammaproteobacteria bacterium]|nr:MAG: acyl-CoA thioesterase [Gammaproteobacteria bacterium]
MDGLPEGRQPVLRLPATPQNTNAGGDIFGGWLMAQVDIAGSIPAVLRAEGRVVTAAVRSMSFLKPVRVGDLVSLYAEVIKVGRSSLQVAVEVWVQRRAPVLEALRVAEAELVYVAIDDAGRPRPVPPAGT